VKKLVLHAGTHKTGTTALQVFAKQNPTLLGQLGVYYPHNGIPHSGVGHHLLAWSLTGQEKDALLWPDQGRSAAHTWRAVIEEGLERPEQLILVSSEELSTLNEGQIRNIGEIASGYELQVAPVLYFRRFDDYLQAIYTTNVLLGYPIEHRPISDYLAEYRIWLDYTRPLAAWRTVFGTAVVARPFHRTTLKSNSIICDLFDQLGYSVDPNDVRAYTRTNSGVPWNIVELARFLNRFGVRRQLLNNLWGWAARVYEGRVSYELLAPSVRRDLVLQTLGFFEREFAEWQGGEMWSHLRGEDLPSSDETWQKTHARGSFLRITLEDMWRAWATQRSQTGDAVLGRHYGSL